MNTYRGRGGKKTPLSTGPVVANSGCTPLLGPMGRVAGFSGKGGYDLKEERFKRSRGGSSTKPKEKSADPTPTQSRPRRGENTVKTSKKEDGACGPLV